MKSPAREVAEKIVKELGMLDNSKDCLKDISSVEAILVSFGQERFEEAIDACISELHKKAVKETPHGTLCTAEYEKLMEAAKICRTLKGRK